VLTSDAFVFTGRLDDCGRFSLPTSSTVVDFRAASVIRSAAVEAAIITSDLLPMPFATARYLDTPAAGAILCEVSGFLVASSKLASCSILINDMPFSGEVYDAAIEGVELPAEAERSIPSIDARGGLFLCVAL